MDENLGDKFQLLNNQLLAEREKVKALLEEKSDLQNSRSFRLIQWFWRIRVKVIPNGSRLANILNLGPHGFSGADTPASFSKAEPKYRNLVGGRIDANTDALAKQLNNALFTPVNLIPPDEINILWKSLERILVDKYRSTPTDLEAWYWHRYRIYLIIQELEAIIDPNVPNLRVLEMGGENPCTDLFRERFPNTAWNNTRGDLRQPWRFDSDSIDLVVSTEVLEHLQDLPLGLQDSFTGSGLTAALTESYRVLKPGGRLFFTTPNAASIWHLRNCLLGNEPWFLKSHIREYTLPEMENSVESLGFITQRTNTVHCMTCDFGIDYTDIFDLLLEGKFPTANRGDDIFYLAYKQENPKFGND
jgi:SAM-dependent methyltransferase